MKNEWKRKKEYTFLIIHNLYTRLSEKVKEMF